MLCIVTVHWTEVGKAHILENGCGDQHPAQLILGLMNTVVYKVTTGDLIEKIPGALLHT